MLRLKVLRAGKAALRGLTRAISDRQIESFSCYADRIKDRTGGSIMRSWRKREQLYLTMYYLTSCENPKHALHGIEQIVNKSFIIYSLTF
jgi:hypothetical protein